jgi:hypothetical protein
VEEVLEEFQSLNTVGESERAGYTWADREWESVVRSVIDGEVFLRTFDQGDGTTLVRFVEPEQVRQPLGSPSRGPSASTTTKTTWSARWPTRSATTSPTTGTRWALGDEPSEVERALVQREARAVRLLFDAPRLFDGLRKLLRNMRESGAVQAAVAWIEQFDEATAGALNTHVNAVSDQNRPDFPGRSSAAG